MTNDIQEFIENENIAAAKINTSSFSEGMELTRRTRSAKIATIFDALKSLGITESVGLNEMNNKRYIIAPLPWRGDYKNVEWTQNDDSMCFAMVQGEVEGCSEKDIQHALTIAAEINKFNPVLKRLENLPNWDNTLRLGTCMTKILGASPIEYTTEVEKLCFRAMIARTLRPGTKFDYVPVLEGRQGLGKSTFLRRLALEDEFYTDCFSGALLGKKDGSELCQGKLLVEFSELSGMKGSEPEAVKSWITRTNDEYRAPYGRYTESHPRRFVVFGTTNKAEYLQDRTGNRRWLSIKCGALSPELSAWSSEAKEYIEQAWAEAWKLYKEDTSPLVLPEHVEQDALAAREAATYGDLKADIIGEYLSEKEIGERVCPAELIENALNQEAGRVSAKDSQEIQEIMQAFPNWEKLSGRQRAGQGKTSTATYERIY